MSFVENVGAKFNDYFSRLEVDDEDGNEFTDRWNTGELLCLASAVQRSGDKNWVSVSRAIKPFGDPKRPSDWYTPKNCALQYSKLLKGVEDFKKKSLPRTERETSEELLVKNLTDRRLAELNWLNQQSKALANSLKVHMELLESGEYDEHLDDLYKQIEEQEKKEEEDFKEWIIRRETLNAAKKLNKCRIPLSKGKAPSRILDSKRKNSQSLDLEDNSVHSTVLDIIKQEIDTDHEFSPSSRPVHIKTEIDAPSSIAALLEGCKSTPIISSIPPAAPTSPLLTSLLRNIPSSNTGAPVVSYVNSPLKEVKVEKTAQPSNTSADSPRKTEVFLSPTKTVVAGISPLLTSLLKSPTSAVPTSTSMASHSKEADSSMTLDIKTELDLSALLGKSQETSPRSSLPQSPRPTPASSPLLNSLLKNSPSAASPLTSIQLSQAKETSTPKAVSSPQSFFNPTSALATAAAQQLAVATSSLPQSHMFFSPQDSEIRKMPLPSSPATSACLSAPTLSKLLEMPPSTPGRLPPLPVVDPVTNTVTTPPATTPDPVLMPSPKRPSTATMLLNEFELHISSSSPTKKSTEVISTTHLSPVSIPSPPKKVLTPVPSVEKTPIVITSDEIVETVTVDQKVIFKHPGEDVTSQENIDILEAVCESINQAFEKKEIKQEVVDPETNQYTQGNPSNKNPVCVDITSAVLTMTENSLPDDLLNIEKLVSSDIALEKVFSSEDISDASDLNIFEDDKQKSSDMEVENPPDILTFEAGSEGDEEDKANGCKFYKSRTTKKRLPEDDLENPAEIQAIPKKPSKPDVLPQIPVNEHLLLAAKEAEEATMQKTPEKSPSKSSDTKSPAAKKPRLFEKVATKEKKELSEDEIPLSKRPGRKAKKGRRMTKSTPVKSDEPKDQYEFSESTEENSVGYQATNSLCYMPRSKEEIRFDEAKLKQGSEDIHPPSNIIPIVEKKPGSTPVKNKPGRPPSQPSARKALFTSDEERMSDSMTSDDASSSHFGEANLKWKEFTEKKEDTPKDVEEGPKSSQKPAKIADSPKKKLQQAKRNLLVAKNETPKKEKKIVGSDVEESSACSRDSEDAASATAWPKEEAEVPVEKKIVEDTFIQDNSPNVAEDVDVEANNDSHMSSSIAAESDKQMDEVEGSESLQGSVTTDFSPLPQSEVKEEKDLTQFGKQDWFHGVSPKSSEPVSQSSEESDYESDNWDNQSVSTNKSATHSAGPSTKTKRKDRESPQYKAWKKAIGIVLREASCHKYANLFLQKVTNDVAPGYLNIVYRPMDLSLIKKNVDNGVVKTTAEVHRDLLLMFQNAVMYNSSDHKVHHWAVEMQRDVIQQMQAFLTTQFNDQDEVSEPTSSLRGARSTKSQKIYASSSKSKEETHEKE